MSNTVAVVKKNVVDIVENKVRAFQSRNELDLPDNYSPSNAMKSAWLELQEVKNRNGGLAIENCSQGSIANALLNMVVQGLNPAKKQCYFIAYGNSLVMQRSYFGTMHVAKSVCPDIQDIYSDVVYADDTFEYEKSRGRTVITKHSQKLANVNANKLVAAYCTIIFNDGTENSTIMTLDECKNSWKKSKMNPVSASGEINEKSTHGQYTAEMMKKTVTNKACKVIINSSDDSNVMISRQLDSQVHEMAVEAEVQENANTVTVDIDDEPSKVDTNTGEVIEQSTEEAHTDESFEDIASGADF